jgi:hypothetical protein
MSMTGKKAPLVLVSNGGISKLVSYFSVMSALFTQLPDKKLANALATQ